MFPEVFLNPRNSKVVSYKHLPFKKVCIIRFTIQTIYNTDVFFELNRNYYSSRLNMSITAELREYFHNLISSCYQQIFGGNFL